VKIIKQPQKLADRLADLLAGKPGRNMIYSNH
jgi:hypothetical protein